MALNPKYSNEAVNAEANALGALLNNGYLRIYDGTQAATADTAIEAQVLLAELDSTPALSARQRLVLSPPMHSPKIAQRTPPARHRGIAL